MQKLFDYMYINWIKISKYYPKTQIRADMETKNFSTTDVSLTNKYIKATKESNMYVDKLKSVMLNASKVKRNSETS